VPNSTICEGAPAKQRVSKNDGFRFAAPLLYRSLIKWAFDRFYREFAWTYDTVAWLVSRGLWREWTLAALPYLNGRVLELGCGTGYVQYALAEHYAELVVGLDASPFMLRHTKRRLLHTSHATRLVHAVAQKLPFAPASFDTILATFPSEYILHPETLSQIQTTLAPDGQYILVDAARFTSDGWYERAVDLAYRLTFQASVVRKQPPTHPYLHLFEQAGFSMQVHREQVGNSEVQVMVGRKQDGT
jgi:ubiquinone/menaquinone biosynthesis C-methylase UbiE